MLFWILAALAVYMATIFLPTLLYLPTEGLKTHLAGRDAQPERTVMAERARKALVNTQENLPIFLTLALLSMIVEGANTSLAETGAMLFVLGRAAYPICYLTAIPGPRSLAYGVGLLGCFMIAFALI